MTANEFKAAIIAAAKHVDLHQPTSSPSTRADCFVAHLTGAIDAHGDLKLARTLWGVYGKDYPLPESLRTPSPAVTA